MLNSCFTSGDDTSDGKSSDSIELGPWRFLCLLEGLAAIVLWQF